MGDITIPDTLTHAFDAADVVVHAAGMLGQAGVAEGVYTQLHVAGTRHVLEAVQRSSPQARVLHVSSPGVLGPITGAVAADETWPLAPGNAYERSKAAAEQVVAHFAGRLDVRVVRPEFIYGPGDEHVLGLFRAVQRGVFFYVDGGEHVCHPTYIDDAVAGMLLVLEKGRAGAVYHVMGERPVSFRDFGRTIAAELDVRPPWLSLPRPLALAGAMLLEKTLSHPPLSRTGVAFFSESRRFSWQRAHDELGYTPQTALPQGIGRTVAWYRAHALLKMLHSVQHDR
jgi:nucleoside-diphosphate-sugar epimerase